MNEQINWRAWEDDTQLEKGAYLWRLESKVMPGIFISFTALTSEVNDVIVPPFYRWTGWTAAVPPCEWAHIPGELGIPRKGLYENLKIEGLEFVPCPFCHKIPTLTGLQYSDGGFIVCASPANYNNWRLTCCDWGRTPSYETPHAIENDRRKAFEWIREHSHEKNS